MPSKRNRQASAGEKSRLQPLTGGYYWFPAPDDGSVAWSVLTCQDLRFGAGIGHTGLWPAVIDRLAQVWNRDQGFFRTHLKNHYTGLPRGRVTEPPGRLLVCHGNDAPAADWLQRVIRKFDLDGRSVRAVFDEHERTLREGRAKVNEVLGIDLCTSRSGIKESQ
ncbi:MAG: hypothetical protein ACLQVF_30955 [Isosphaeraceae bacterium]